MCKEGIRLGRGYSFTKSSNSFANTNVNNLLGPRADRVAFGCVVRFIGSPTWQLIGGSFDPATGAVSETILAQENALAWILVGDGSDALKIKIASPYFPNVHLPIEHYGLLITQSISIQFVSALGGRCEWFELFTERGIDEL